MVSASFGRSIVVTSESQRIGLRTSPRILAIARRRSNGSDPDRSPLASILAPR